MTAAGALVAELLACQRADGAFAAEVHFDDGGVLVDHNVFATVQVVRALAGAALPALAGPIARALDFLAAARSPAGTSNHWPPRDQPRWLPRLPDDADDTALVTGALVTHGRLAEPDAIALMMEAVVPHRLEADPARQPAWTAAGGYRTWLAPSAFPGALDAAVNANVVGTLAALGLRGAPGYQDACALVRAAVAFAREAPEALRTTITPFYPALHELDVAIALARAAGARELAGLTPLVELGDEQREAPWIARAAYGGPRWRSRAVGLARLLARA